MISKLKGNGQKKNRYQTIQIYTYTYETVWKQWFQVERISSFYTYQYLDNNRGQIMVQSKRPIAIFNMKFHSDCVLKLFAIMSPQQYSL